MPQQQPRTCTDWYTDAIAVLDRCRSRAQQLRTAGAPVMQNQDLAMAAQLAQQVVHLDDPDAY